MLFETVSVYFPRRAARSAVGTDAVQRDSAEWRNCEIVRPHEAVILHDANVAQE